MTLKPSEQPREDEGEENSSPNSPETNEETNQSAENEDPNKLTFFVGQQLDVLDSVNYWTEAEVTQYFHDSSNFVPRW
jgi:hypothetical protein